MIIRIVIIGNGDLFYCCETAQALAMLCFHTMNFINLD